ncbi:MAG: V-type ATP synthase subunit E [Chloroflexi bacterium]|nr:V-type ATP synthase subunit E [Chloroflexota bacterium]
MPLANILRAMQTQADAEIARITDAAECEAEQLIAEAETQATAIRARHRARVEPLLATEAAAILNRAKLGALRELANAREHLLNDAFAQAHAQLASMRGSNHYAAIFRALAREAIQNLNGDLVARVDPRDVALAHATLTALNANVAIETAPIPLGGLELHTRDGRIVIVNTLSARLERARETLRGPVARILVGEIER